MGVISVGGHTGNIRPLISTHARTHILVLRASHTQGYRQFKTCFLIFLSDFVCQQTPAKAPAVANFCRCSKRAEKAITGSSAVYMLHRYTHMLPTPGVANVMALH